MTTQTKTQCIPCSQHKNQLGNCLKGYINMGGKCVKDNTLNGCGPGSIALLKSCSRTLATGRTYHKLCKQCISFKKK